MPTSFGVSESCVVGSIEALGFVPVIQRPRFYLARPLPAVSCLPLGKSFALNGFRVLGSEKRPFPFTTFQERVLIHMNLFTWQGWSHFAHSLANCHPVMSFQAIKMWLKARMWVQTPTEVATRQMYVRLFFAGWGEGQSLRQSGHLWLGSPTSAQRPERSRCLPLGNGSTGGALTAWGPGSQVTEICVWLRHTTPAPNGHDQASLQ